MSFENFMAKIMTMYQNMIGFVYFKVLLLLGVFFGNFLIVNVSLKLVLGFVYNMEEMEWCKRDKNVMNEWKSILVECFNFMKS